MAGTGRVDHLDGIRAVAIGAVLTLHWISWYTPFFHGGSVGVDVFFVLSGFLITTMLWRLPVPTSTAAAWAGFLRRRAVRLYPALLGFVLVTVVAYALVPWAPVGLGDVLERGALAVGQGSALWAADRHGSLWLPGLQPFGQTWSLAVEWYFYLLWPLLVLAARRAGWSAVRLGHVCLAVAVLGYAASLPLGTFWFYFGPSARFAELLVGAALGLRYAAVGTPRPHRAVRGGSVPAVLALAGLAAYTLLGRDGHDLAYRLVGVPVAVLATVALIRTGYRAPDGLVARFLSHRWPAAIGRQSYSLYLWHLVPFLLLGSAPTSLPRPFLGLLAIVVAVVLTRLSHRWLEQPFLRPRGDLPRPTREQAEPEPTPAPR